MTRRRQSLNGLWRYTPQVHQVLKPGGVLEESTAALPPGGEMQIPCNWQLGGLNNFHGSVRFEREFIFTPQPADGAGVWLVFQAVDYQARVWLNEVYLGEHTGYFAPFEFDVSKVVREGPNVLVLEVSDPLEEPGTVWPDHKQVIKGVLSHWDCRPGSWSREHGQDRNCGGIWHAVYLETRPATFVGHVRTATRLAPRTAPPGFALHGHFEPGPPYQALVMVDAEIVGESGEYTVAAEIAGSTTQQKVRHSYSGQRHTLIVSVPEPKLWWTWDRGEPHLETCTVRVTGAHDTDQVELQIGLREVEVNPKTGEWKLNKERLFIRGTNVIPTLWLGEYDDAMIARDIEMLLAAHMNAVRVCVHINRTELYAACDRAGLLIWQDFALQWGYEESTAVMQAAVSQIREMVRLLVNHPSIAVWSCQNESTFHNKFIMDPALEMAVALEDGSRYIRATSEFTEHNYPGWYYGDLRDYALLGGTPILTEFGGQSLPKVQDARTMGGDQWPPDWAMLSYHDFQYDQTFLVAGIQTGDSWEEFAANSQAYQARLLKFAIEHYRQAKYTRLGGMFQFMFMDCWPSVTWAVVEYDRTPKQAYYTLQQVYQPVLIGANIERDRLLTSTDRGSHPRPLLLSPWVVNDRTAALAACTYHVQLDGPDGVVDAGTSAPFDVPADGVLARAPAVEIIPPPPGRYSLRLTLLCDGQELSGNSYELTYETLPVDAKDTSL
ncbi:MAG: glycoside hydrolase family 2 TIM barrel-domain containing protein [Caldilineaceae bacterium]